MSDTVRLDHSAKLSGRKTLFEHSSSSLAWAFLGRAGGLGAGWGACPTAIALATSVFVVLLVGCTSKQPEEASLGVAYVGPAKLVLRTDLTVRSPERITVSHGDRVDILEVRRKFVRVRTAEGTQGWTDANTLMTSDQIADLAHLGEAAQKLPSQGLAKVFDQLNVHTEAARQSPSFFQIAENGSVDVVGHRVAPRNQPTAKVALTPPPPPRAAKKPKGKAAKSEPLL